MNVALLLHGQKNKAVYLGQKLGSYCPEVTFTSFVSSRIGQGEELCQKALNQGFDHLIFIGGDGWFNEGINALCKYFKNHDDLTSSAEDRYDWQAIAMIRVGFVPAGSGNDFVKSLSSKGSVHSLGTLLSAATLKKEDMRMDVGHAVYQTEKGPNEQFFINIADVGMGSAAMKRKEKLPIWLGATMRYLMAIVGSVLSYKPVTCSINVDGVEWQGEVSNAVVAQGQCFGHGLYVAPDASLIDGAFDVIVIPPFGFRDFVKQYVHLRKARPLTHPGVHTFRGSKVEITPSPGNNVAPPELEMDGDHIGVIPVRFECLKQKLTILDMPKSH